MCAYIYFGIRNVQPKIMWLECIINEISKREFSQCVAWPFVVENTEWASTWKFSELLWYKVKFCMTHWFRTVNKGQIANRAWCDALIAGVPKGAANNMLTHIHLDSGQIYQPWTLHMFWLVESAVMSAIKQILQFFYLSRSTCTSRRWCWAVIFF
jgi:hypothetical protein